ncbi:MAG: phosphotransferase [Acidimicrobiia bacterium]|nr:phosphotransferase [Acidimicrobiia bacterium]
MTALDAGALASWLGVAEVVLEGAPTGGGWSNDTVFVSAGGLQLVVRLTPTGTSMFPSYDLGHQVRCLELAAASGLAVPELVGYEPTGEALGRPFFVMARVAGRVPADDDPPFTKAGFLVEATPGQHRAFHDAAVRCIAAVHGIPAPGFVEVGPGLGDHMAWCQQLCRWSATAHPVIDAAHDALAAALPAHSTGAPRFLWGDARPANMVLDEDFEVVAMLDWELACSGPGELDVAWFCEMNRMRATGMGLSALAGWPDEATTWAQWAAAVGREPEHRGWHRRYAAYKVAVLMQLYLRAMVERGRLPARHRLFVDNPGTRRLEELDE